MPPNRKALWDLLQRACNRRHDYCGRTSSIDWERYFAWSSAWINAIYLEVGKLDADKS